MNLKESKQLAAGEQIDVYNQIFNINHNEWVELSDYLQNEENLPFDHRNVQIIQKTIQMIQTGRSISQRQAEATLKILQEAIDKNFNYVR